MVPWGCIAQLKWGAWQLLRVSFTFLFSFRYSAGALIGEVQLVFIKGKCTAMLELMIHGLYRVRTGSASRTTPLLPAFIVGCILTM